ncbi:MAG: hypothetical protein IPP66_18080 [Anaerolineales bacterium]|nr:hypothetical protein [Anaerolineales bacterium]
MMSQNRMYPALKLRFSDIVFIAVLFVALILGQQMLSLDSDLGRHLTLGNYILDKRIIPTIDLLSHTRAGISRPPYEWLSQVIFALANRLLGLDGVVLLSSLVIALTFTLIYQFANRRSGSPIVTLLLVFLAAGASSIHWLPRPHIFTFLLLAIWVEQLDQFVEGKLTNIYIFPIIMLFWANMHGGFIFGILVWIAYFAGWLWDVWRKKSDSQVGKKLLLIGVLSSIATIITPDLWHNWDAVINNRSAFILNRTVETMRPNLLDTAILPYTVLLVLTVLLCVLNWKTIKAHHVFLLAGLGLMSLVMARNIPLFTIACTPLLAEMSTSLLSKSKVWSQIEHRFAGFNTEGRSIWPFIATLLAVTYFLYFNFRNDHSLYQFDSNIFPVGAVNFLEENPQSGNMFNEFNWGGYLEYRLWPHHKVLLDSQSDFYGETLMREYDQLFAAKDDWETLLEKYQVDWAIGPSNAPLVSALQNKQSWDVIYQDAVATVLRKP